MGLEERFLRGDQRALARVISLLEAGAPEGRGLLQALRGGTRGAEEPPVIGVTGPPGSGKSTLVDRLIESSRRRERRVAVLAIDPSSPFSGGAILGDRIRMTRWHDDDGVFIRSMAARGHLGGLAGATLQVLALLGSFGVDDILVETVGVGQSEVEVSRVADTTAVVLTPGQGDGVQAVKAGLMEIADVFVVNKADQGGSRRLVAELRAMLELLPAKEGAWTPPVVEVVASEGRGVDGVTDALEAHRRYLETTGGLIDRRRGRARAEVMALVRGAVERAMSELELAEIDALSAGSASPDALAERLARRLVAHRDRA